MTSFVNFLKLSLLVGCLALAHACTCSVAPSTGPDASDALVSGPCAETRAIFVDRCLPYFEARQSDASGLYNALDGSVDAAGLDALLANASPARQAEAVADAHTLGYCERWVATAATCDVAFEPALDCVSRRLRTASTTFCDITHPDLEAIWEDCTMTQAVCRR